LEIEIARHTGGRTKVIGRAEDAVGLDRVEASGDGGATWVLATGKDSWFVTLEATPGEVVVRAIDLAGNEARESKTIATVAPLGAASTGVLAAAGLLLFVGSVVALRARRGRRRDASPASGPRAPEAAVQALGEQDKS
jgi:hypothetical protein